MKTKKSFYGKIFLITSVALLIIFGGRRSFGYSWEKTFGGSGRDIGSSVQQTTDGGYIIAGTIQNIESGEDDVYLIKTDPLGNELWTQAFGGGWGYWVQQTTDGGYIIVGTVGDSNIYLIKTNANGDELWSKTFVGELGWLGNPLQQTTDGGYIITGFYRHPPPDDKDFVYLIKTDADGNEMWSKTFDELSEGGGFGVQQTTDEGYIIVGAHGYFRGPWVTPDVYLIKTNADGNEMWSKTFGGSDADFGFSVQQTTDGGYIITGKTGIYGEEVYTGDVYLIKTDADGNEMWSKTFGGSENDEGNSVQQTDDGGYIIAGNTNSYGEGSYDVYLIRTDADGNEQWSKTFGGVDYDGGYSVQQTTDEGYIIVGRTRDWSISNVYLIYYKPDEFADVPPGYWAEDAIYKIYEAEITKGCSQDPLMYCPTKTVYRDQMAVFLGRATHESNFTPPDATGIFADVPKWYWAADWIEQFYADGLTKGCKTDPHDVQSLTIYYCPKYPVTRTTMAIFLLRTKHGANYQPPAATGIFEDVWVNYWAADWIEQLYKEGITKGCKQNPLMYCPSNHVTRSQMAVFLARMLGL